MARQNQSAKSAKSAKWHFGRMACQNKSAKSAKSAIVALWAHGLPKQVGKVGKVGTSGTFGTWSLSHGTKRSSRGPTCAGAGVSHAHIQGPCLRCAHERHRVRVRPAQALDAGEVCVGPREQQRQSDISQSDDIATVARSGAAGIDEQAETVVRIAFGIVRRCALTVNCKPGKTEAIVDIRLSTSSRPTSTLALWLRRGRPPREQVEVCSRMQQNAVECNRTQ